MNQRSVAACLPLLALSICSASVRAEQIEYGIEFKVGYYTFGTPDPRVSLGEVYAGTFSVDSSILAQDGINKSGDVGSFTVTMENITWAMGDPNSEFRGFRGPAGLGAPSPGFDVVDGQITNLRGGVFGSGDFPFIDFSFEAGLPFSSGPSCQGSYCGNKPNAFHTISTLGAFGGTMTIHAIAAPVPEPETYAMAILGAGIVGFSLRRKPQGKG